MPSSSRSSSTGRSRPASSSRSATTTTSTSSCPSGRPPRRRPEAGPARPDRGRPCSIPSACSISGAIPPSRWRSDPGPHLVWGPNAAGKTSLLEAIVLLAWGRSHRTSTDGELIRWGTDLARVEGHVGVDTVEVAVARSGAGGTGGRKRIRVNGLGRRAGGLDGPLRVVVFAPEEMLLVVGSPGLRRATLDQLAARARAGLREHARHVRADAPAAQRAAPRDPGGRRRAGTSCASGTTHSSTPAARIVADRLRAPRPPRRAPGAGPRGDRPRRGRRREP